MSGDVCPLCDTAFQPDRATSVLTAKGVESLASANEARNDATIMFSVGQRVHTDCRVKYCHKREIRK